MPKEYGLPCPVARSLDIVGDRWTLLIIRDLLSIGPRKYVELSESLGGIAPNVLSDRLKLLESHGIVEREFYEQHPPRARYKLTKKGAELRTVMLSLLDWGYRHLYDGVAAIHAPCGHEIEMRATCPHCETPVRPREIAMDYRSAEAAELAAKTRHDP
jgi:DNA-binding HxlR family transcriptional regulator